MSRSAVALARSIVPRIVPAPDAALLKTFIASRTDDVFAELVRRHGPMVLAVCNRVLADEHDAEDAFQAVFIVLARKAGTIRGTNLAAWLHGVATRTANGVRVTRKRRRKYERATRERPPTEAPRITNSLGSLTRNSRTFLKRTAKRSFCANCADCRASGLRSNSVSPRVRCPVDSQARSANSPSAFLLAALLRRLWSAHFSRHTRFPRNCFKQLRSPFVEPLGVLRARPPRPWSRRCCSTSSGPLCWPLRCASRSFVADWRLLTRPIRLPTEVLTFPLLGSSPIRSIW